MTVKLMNDLFLHKLKDIYYAGKQSARGRKKDGPASHKARGGKYQSSSSIADLCSDLVMRLRRVPGSQNKRRGELRYGGAACLKQLSRSPPTLRLGKERLIFIASIF